LLKSHEAQITALKKAMQEEAERAAESAVAAENERMRLVAELNVEKVGRETAIADLQGQFAEEKRRMEEEAKRALEALRRELQSAADDSENLTSRAHADEIARLKEAAEKATGQLTLQMAERERQLGQEKEKAVAVERERAERELKEAMGKMQKQQEAALAAQQVDLAVLKNIS
jgi:hypothetical protein